MPRHAGHALSVQEVHTAASVSVGRVNRVEMSGARSNLGTAVAVVGFIAAIVKQQLEGFEKFIERHKAHKA